MASGLLLIIRYVMIMHVMTMLEQTWWLDYLTDMRQYTWWSVGSIGFTLPGIFAVDQLIRHPAITPKKLLRWYLLFLLAEATTVVITIVGTIGWSFAAQLVLLIGFAGGFVGVCVLLARKVPSAPLRRALGGLALSYGYLGARVLLLFPLGAALGQRWINTIAFSSEIAALLALWYAYETSARLQQAV